MDAKEGKPEESKTTTTKPLGKRSRSNNESAKENSQQSPPAPQTARTIQFYLPPGSTQDAQSLLEHSDNPLTEEDVLAFCRDGTLPTPLLTTNASVISNFGKKDEKELQQILVDAYHERRRNIQDLAWKLWEGEAYVDDFGRLVPVAAVEDNSSTAGAAERHDENNNNPPLGRGNHNNHNNHNNNNLGNNNNNNNLGDNNNNFDNFDNLNPINNNNNNQAIPFPLDPEEEERRWTEQEEQEASRAIARAVQRYRTQGVPEHDFVVLRVKPTERPERASLTFRRICFAVLAVVTAFLCIMLQTLPLFPRDVIPNPLFDKLLYELLQVRHFGDHVQTCPQLNRSPPPSTHYLQKNVTTTTTSWFLWWIQRLWQWVVFTTTSTISFSSLSSSKTNDYHQQRQQQAYFEYDQHDCSDGVLHIPTVSVLEDAFFAAASTKVTGSLPSRNVWEPYFQGVNVSWFLPCHFPDDMSTSSTTLCQTISDEDHACYAHQNHDWLSSSSSSSEPPLKCFRGVHDNIITEQEVGEALRLGHQLIQNGGDHFDIHSSPKELALLHESLPTLLSSVERLLQDRYGINKAFNGKRLRPVAFRVHAVGPLDGSGVIGSIGQTSNYLLRVLNRPRYVRWIDKIKRHNDLARYSLPLLLPSRLKPFRDPCHLMADLEADPRFAIHSTIFLSNGAGRDYRGGVSLYVDDHPSNNVNPRRKVQRGVTIDGSIGRIVVSTGGLENLRCRLPVREGVRAALQIWWNCDGTR